MCQILSEIGRNDLDEGLSGGLGIDQTTRDSLDRRGVFTTRKYSCRIFYRFAIQEDVSATGTADGSDRDFPTDANSKTSRRDG